MAVLSQFQKQGGFRQLLQLVELSDPLKQKNLFHLIAQEDPGWAHLIRVKMLTLDKVLAWPPAILVQVISPLPIPLLSQLYAQVSENHRQILDQCLTVRSQRELREFRETHGSEPLELWAAQVKLLQCIREMESLGLLSLSEIDPTLVWEQNLAA
jgi:flagellar motor switch protein FliG